MNRGHPNNHWTDHLPNSEEQEATKEAILETTKDGETSADALEGQGISRRMAVHSLRKLSEAGFGKFVVGRRTRPTRLEWYKPPTETAKANGTITYRHPLRLDPRQEVQLEVPADLTREELERVQHWIASLPTA